MAVTFYRAFGLYAVLLGSLAVSQFAAAHGGAQKQDEYLRDVRASAQQLVHDLEELQNVVVSELSGQKERSLFRRVDGSLREALAFQNALKDGVNRNDLYRHFEHLDPKLHELLQEVRSQGVKQKALQRAIDQVLATDDHLHYVLSAGDTTEARVQKVIERQAKALAVTAQDLERTATFALGDASGQAVLLGDLKTFDRAAQQFNKIVHDNKDKKVTQAAFVAVNASWDKVIAGLKSLPPEDNVFLLRSATRADQLHDRLFRLLGMKGERPNLTIRT